jgi:hypothetical protein
MLAVMMGRVETGAALTRDRINVMLLFDGRVYHGAQALYSLHDTMLPAGVEDDVRVSYYTMS